LRFVTGTAYGPYALTYSLESNGRFTGKGCECIVIEGQAADPGNGATSTEPPTEYLTLDPRFGRQRSYARSSRS
jgi:hypothetical protein